MKYIILTGALKNVGDYLIAERAKKLIIAHKPGAELIEFSRYESLDDKLEIINSSNAVILAGGPGYSYNMYPGVFKLADDLNKIKVPIISMGMGWYGITGTDKSIYNYKYSNKSISMLKRSSQHCYLGCRDYLTERTLNNMGLKNTLMTGCVAWYDMNYINHPYEINSEVKSVVFSNPAAISNVPQAIEVLKLIVRKYPESKLYCAFHRGVDPDQFTSTKEANAMLKLKENAEELGYQILDLSYDLEKMKIYDECDLHIGYRVHAHIYCLSHHKKSILIEEDGRGKGANDALGLYGVAAKERILLFTNIAEKLPKDSILVRLMNRVGVSLKSNKYAITNLSSYIDELKKNDYSNIENGFINIKNSYKNMVKFINEMP